VNFPGAGCQVGGVGLVFVPKCAFSPGGDTAWVFGVAIFALYNRLVIRQLRLKGPKEGGVYLKLVYFLLICYKLRKLRRGKVSFEF